MQFTILINQAKSVEWGLDLKLAGLFAFLYQVPSWASEVHVNGKTWYWISRAKILEEIPVLGVSTNAVYRYMKELEKKGLISLSNDKSIGMTLMRLTEKAKQWNNNDCNTYCETANAPIAELQKGYCKTADVSYNHISNNQGSVKTPVPSDDGTQDSDSKKAKGYPAEFESLWQQYPKRSGSNPKRSAFKAWSARLKAGARIDDIAEGVKRYRKFIIATGKMHSQFVMQAATFFGPDERYLEDWTSPAVSAGRQNGIAQPMAPDGYTPADDSETPDWMRGLESGDE